MISLLTHYVIYRIGRRLSFFTCLATLITGGFLTSISNSFWTWAATRVVVGLTIPAIYQIPFIISLELVGPNYRSFVTVMTCSFYTMGLCMLAGVTYLIRDWRTLAVVTSAPFLLYILYWWFLPESPRWLLAKGRLGEANDILERLAKVNGKELPLSFTQKLRQRMMMSRSKSEEERLRSGPGVLSLFKTPNMRLKTCLITLNWFANNMVYVGLSYYGPALGNEEHLSFFFSSLAEIPSYMACWVVMDRWGRRWPLCLCMVVAGISCITTVLLSPGIESFREKQGNERSPHRINSDDSDEQTNRESPLFLIVFLLLLLLLFYRCSCDHANSIPLIEIRDIGLLSNYISVRR